MIDLRSHQTRTPSREKETSKEIQPVGTPGVQPSRTTTRKAVASSDQGVIENEGQDLRTWIQHEKDNLAAKALLVLCNKPATCKSECLYENTLQRTMAGPGLSNMLYCGLLLSGSTLPPFLSHPKILPSLLFYSPSFPRQRSVTDSVTAVPHFFLE